MLTCPLRQRLKSLLRREHFTKIKWFIKFLDGTSIQNRRDRCYGTTNILASFKFSCGTVFPKALVLRTTGDLSPRELSLRCSPLSKRFKYIAFFTNFKPYTIFFQRRTHRVLRNVLKILVDELIDYQG